MRNLIVAVLILAFALPALPARAQTAGGSPSELQTEMRRKRHVILPRVDPRTVSEDVERAQAEGANQTRQEHLIRDVTRDVTQPHARRPDLDPDVVSGIQQRNIGRIRR